MDHNLHHPPLHWGYTSTPPQNPWVPPPQTRSLKRALSESDCDELYSEESSKDQTSFKRTSPGDSDSCQLLSRKKRRGVIEKKRRDRINSSLSELKRLVPSAYEKQGSAKLEKAEILQLTVDHLKSLHAKGLDTIAYDPQRFAMDYHIIGFRECASEVARYLVTIEGMDIQDPLRLRLMSHLQYFVQQRELSAKAGTSPNWSSSSYHQPNYTPPAYQGYPTQSTSSSYIPNLPPPIQPYSTVNPPSTMHHHTIPHSTPTTSTATSSDSSSLMSVPSQQQQPTHLQHPQQVTSQQQSGQPAQEQQPQPQQHYSAEHEHHHDHQGTRQYVDLTSNEHSSPSTSIAYGPNPPYPPTGAQAYNTPGNVNYGGNGSKPYRPWGAEMAY